MPPTHALAPQLLALLRVEAQLLRDAAVALAEVHAAVRRGGPIPPLPDPVPAERPSAGVAAELAGHLGLPTTATLAQLADALPEPWATDLRGVRDDLRAAADDVKKLHARNATLLGSLRSFLRGVEAGGPVAQAPARYGRSGERLGLPTAGVIQARG